MDMRTRVASVALLLVFFPLFAHALVRMSEIMYDIEGTDTGREWIEVANEGAASVDISGFKLFEANVNHGLTLYAGSAVLASGGYAIIADNPSKFLTDWPGWSGSLFDSSFSLSNTGESLAIKNGTLEEEDAASYAADMGAQGDGQSLARNGNGWQAGAATPGASNGGSPASSDSGSHEEASQVASAIVAEMPRFTAYAGEDRKVVVGADALFEAQGYGTDGAPLLNARYVWSFGDAGMAQGKSVFHRYEYPGKYVVMLSVSSGERSTTDRAVVEAVSADLALRSETDGSLSVFNEGKGDVNIGRWILRRAGVTFVLPPDTVILPSGGIRLKVSLLGLPTFGLAELLYPNGALAAAEGEKTAAVLVSEGLIEQIQTSARKPQRVLGTEVSVQAPAPAASPTMESDTEVLAAEQEEEIPNKPANKESVIPWLLAIALVASAGAAGVWYSRRILGSFAEQFEIIDISEKEDSR